MPDTDTLLGISADPVRFEEAIRAIRRRVPMTDETFSALEKEELDFAFTVADVAELDVVVDVYEAITRAVADGETFADFKARVGDELEEAWGAESPARLETVFRTNTMTAYNSGRHEAAHAVRSERPFWRFDGPIDGRTCDICRPCVGVILPADHPWWKRHYPCLHPNCRHRVSTLTREQAEKEGISGHPPDVEVPEGFGKPPALSGGSDWEPDPSDYPKDFRSALEDRLDQDDAG